MYSFDEIHVHCTIIICLLNKILKIEIGIFFTTKLLVQGGLNFVGIVL